MLYFDFDYENYWHIVCSVCKHMEHVYWSIHASVMRLYGSILSTIKRDGSMSLFPPTGAHFLAQDEKLGTRLL
jgi:hypothetical protein